jgi:hypothetical protein
MDFAAAVLASIVAIALPGAPQSIGARLTTSRDVAEPMPFAIPSLKVQGLVRPAAGHRLYVIVLALDEEGVDAEVGQFVLIAGDGATREPIGAGGRADLIMPLDRLPVGREVGEILPTDAIVAFVRRSATHVSVEVGPLGTLAFLYEIPADASVRAIRLPDGRELAIAP